jgi:DNA repair protein RadC
MIIKTNVTKVNSNIQTAQILYKILLNEDRIDRDKEHFWAVGLDTINFIKYIELVALGVSTGVIVHPRETFRTAVMQGVNKIIVAHNHPSGSVEPSGEDIQITNTLKEAGKILNIPLVDHLIIGNTGKIFSIFADKQV